MNNKDLYYLYYKSPGMGSKAKFSSIQSFRQGGVEQCVMSSANVYVLLKKLHFTRSHNNYDSTVLLRFVENRLKQKEKKNKHAVGLELLTLLHFSNWKAGDLTTVQQPLPRLVEIIYSQLCQEDIHFRNSHCDVFFAVDGCPKRGQQQQPQQQQQQQQHLEGADG